MPNSLIVGIESLSAIIFLFSAWNCYLIYMNTRKKTGIWILIGAAVFIAFLTSGFNALEWFYEESAYLDEIGEVLAILFSLAWVYIAYKFISLKSRGTAKE